MCSYNRVCCAMPVLICLQDNDGCNDTPEMEKENCEPAALLLFCSLPAHGHLQCDVVKAALFMRMIDAKSDDTEHTTETLGAVLCRQLLPGRFHTAQLLPCAPRRPRCDARQSEEPIVYASHKQGVFLHENDCSMQSEKGG
jgi:hypothetical protein